jgi:hypothetical protein
MAYLFIIDPIESLNKIKDSSLIINERVPKKEY